MNNVALRKENKGEQGIMTGLHIFDSRYGWHGGDLIIIAGETSQGKSTLATTICYNIAANDVPCLYLSLEMGEEQLVSRIIARSTQVSSSTTLYGRISDEEYNRLYDGSLKLKDLPIYFEEDSKSNFPKMIGAIRRQVKNNKVKVVFIDYLQILANGGRDNREAIIGDMARDLKRLAAELNIVIVALSQLARPSGGASKEPTLNRMRGSGQIEEACDIAVLIYRPNPKTEKANIYIAKGRNIGLGKETIKFNSSLSYFSDFEDGDPDAPYAEKKEELPF
jgi:replicative DNA helicase